MLAKQKPFQRPKPFRITVGEIQDPKIARAKSFPIQNFYNQPFKKTGKVLMGLCPFHKENTPSFAIYPETNTYYCFSCRASGDSIDLYKMLRGTTFAEAVEALAV